MPENLSIDSAWPGANNKLQGLKPYAFFKNNLE
jgi:hypothetical protein